MQMSMKRRHFEAFYELVPWTISLNHSVKHFAFTNLMLKKFWSLLNNHHPLDNKTDKIQRKISPCKVHSTSKTLLSSPSAPWARAPPSDTPDSQSKSSPIDKNQDLRRSRRQGRGCWRMTRRRGAWRWRRQTRRGQTGGGGGGYGSGPGRRWQQRRRRRSRRRRNSCRSRYRRGAPLP